MRERLITTAAILLALLGFATVQMRAEIPIIQADTIFQGFGGGSVSGIAFSNGGNSIILNRVPQPVEVDINSHQIIKEFEKVPNYTSGGGSFFGDETKNIVGAGIYSSDLLGIKNFGGEVIWDATTGKIIKAIPNIILQKNGDKYYTFIRHQNNEYLGRFDIDTYKMADSFLLSKDLPGVGYSSWGTIGIIPNTNKVLAGVQRYTEDEQHNKTYLLSELYLLDFDTKKYTKINIPYEAGQKSSEITNIAVSETGKYNIAVVIISGISNYLFYDRDFNFLFKENNITMNTKIGSNSLEVGQFITFFDDNHAILSCIRDQQENKRNELIYNTENRNFNSIIDFFGGDRVTFNTNKIAMIDQSGDIGIVDIFQVPVKENIPINNSFSEFIYRNASIIFNSKLPEEVFIQITNYNGNLLQEQKNMFLHSGSNTIKLNIALVNGAYFCVIKTQNTSKSFKFMVSN